MLYKCYRGRSRGILSSQPACAIFYLCQEKRRKERKVEKEGGEVRRNRRRKKNERKGRQEEEEGDDGEKSKTCGGYFVWYFFPNQSPWITTLRLKYICKYLGHISRHLVCVCGGGAAHKSISHLFLLNFNPVAGYPCSAFIYLSSFKSKRDFPYSYFFPRILSAYPLSQLLF